MAPPTKRRKKALAAAPSPPPPVIFPADRLSKLPGEILAHILSFLPAQEAVRTCILARAWRDAWKFTRRLLITGDSVLEVREFVKRLLRVRRDGLKLASLDATEIRFGLSDQIFDFDDPSDLDESEDILNKWVRRVLNCKVQTLLVHLSVLGDAYVSLDLPLFSRHLTRLELAGLWFCTCINLDGWPVLEHLEINKCYLRGVGVIMCKSLKRLVITSCHFYSKVNRIQICVPRLVSLSLYGDRDLRTPLLEQMAELVGAEVRINSFLDGCNCKDPMACRHVTEEGYSDDYAGQNTTKCLVLEGLAQAKGLVLIADHSTYIFRRDLRWCPTFSKLKTLILNDYWCESADCSELACMLEHAPILEKLTILFSGTVQLKYDVVVEGRLDATGKSTKISQHLKIIEVKCFEVHQRVLKVLRFLGTLNIWFQFRATEGSR